MHDISKESREFLKDNYLMVRNGFSNEGLIEYNIRSFDNQRMKHLELHIEQII